MDFDGKYESPPLVYAVISGCLEIITLLLKNGAHPGIGTWPALAQAATDDRVDIIEILCNFNAYIDVRTLDGYSLIMLATRFNHADSIRFLCNRGAQMNFVGKDGESLLILAASYASIEIICIFIEYE